ncbi:MAG: DUF1460 domain-containing protein [Verrucomicrobia bacterium]|nr:DUF1460 domain-containing protein [Verrucomicrobiota bacterium]
MLFRCAALLALLLAFVAPTSLPAQALPFETVFKGRDVFDRLVQRAVRENWRALPLGERTTKVALAMVGTPFKAFTLEIDDTIEAPSVNFYGQDCWTTFEISLAFARMLRAKDGNYTPRDLLRLVELNRYRHGKCTGEYLSRFHFLEEMFYDNEKRGLVTNMTRRFQGARAERLQRNIREMTVMWRSYRYLASNPSLRGPMAEVEARVSALPVYHIPKGQAAAIESEIQNGDILAITCRDKGSYTSHVGLAYRDETGALRIIHASHPRNYGRVVIDSRLSEYLHTYSNHFGVIVARPKEAPAGVLAPQLVTR